MELAAVVELCRAVRGAPHIDFDRFRADIDALFGAQLEDESTPATPPISKR